MEKGVIWSMPNDPSVQPYPVAFMGSVELVSFLMIQFGTHPPAVLPQSTYARSPFDLADMPVFQRPGDVIAGWFDSPLHAAGRPWYRMRIKACSCWASPKRRRTSAPPIRAKPEAAP
jgi:hypothetical protein